MNDIFIVPREESKFPFKIRLVLDQDFHQDLNIRVGLALYSKDDQFILSRRSLNLSLGEKPEDALVTLQASVEELVRSASDQATEYEESGTPFFHKLNDAISSLYWVIVPALALRVVSFMVLSKTKFARINSIVGSLDLLSNLKILDWQDGFLSYFKMP